MSRRPGHEALRQRLNELGIRHGYSEHEGKFYECGNEINPHAMIADAEHVRAASREWEREHPKPTQGEVDAHWRRLWFSTVQEPYHADIQGRLRWLRMGEGQFGG